MLYYVQGGLLPPLDRDAEDGIIGSESIIKVYADKHSLTATALLDLIKNVLKNPQFNSDEVDTDMLQRLSAAIDRGEIQIIKHHHFNAYGRGWSTKS